MTDAPALPFPLLRRGKVRDVYDLGEHVLIVASDRISAFDVVLPTDVPEKGIVLTQLSAFWFETTRNVMPNHFITADCREFPSALRPHRRVLRGRATLARKASRIDVECVARGYLAGSAWANYWRSGRILGTEAPPNLGESEILPEPLFTPTTKADSGHDEPLSEAQVAALVGPTIAERLREATLAIYGWARAFAATRGIIIADTKFEFGTVDGQLIVIDELLTPDSSRFWSADAYQPGRSQASFDKQFVRDYLESTGWNKQSPAPRLPGDVIEGTRARYREAYRRIVGHELEY
ncbi:MAG: phosphoribosylaminoimidazolesuccinocarboxamide synthase [Chloroflexota bacterium]|nr:MAG: phosphoribosylaminoimidazolesuccinocarboxamide synthase [Chloroflexota bacterium]